MQRPLLEYRKREGNYDRKKWVYYKREASLFKDVMSFLMWA